MKKEQFLTLLKEVSDKLDAKNIDHEIPYTYFYKKDFNYINIIISNSVNAKKLSEAFNIYEVKEDNEMIKCLYKDFLFHFIKTDPQLWQFTFYHYCWMPLSNLLATTADSMGLTYDRYGLRYKYEGGSILASINLQDILDFFGLPFNDYVVIQTKAGNTGFYTEEIIYSYFCMNSYFNPSVMTEENIRKVDKHYNLHKNYYDTFYTYMGVFSAIEEEMEEPFYYYYLVDEFFPNSGFLRKVYKQITNKDLPNLGNIENLRDQNDLDSMPIRTVLDRAMAAESKYKTQLEEKRKRRKETFNDLLDDIRKNPKFIWED